MFFSARDRHLNDLYKSIRCTDGTLRASRHNISGDTPSETLFTKSGTSNNAVTVTGGTAPSALPSTSNFVFELADTSTPVEILFSSREVAQAFEGFAELLAFLGFFAFGFGCFF